MTGQVYMCYAKNDSMQANMLRKAFSRYGINVWKFDSAEMKADMEEKLATQLEAITESDYFILLISKNLLNGINSTKIGQLWTAVHTPKVHTICYLLDDTTLNDLEEAVKEDLPEIKDLKPVGTLDGRQMTDEVSELAPLLMLRQSQQGSALLDDLLRFYDPGNTEHMIYDGEAPYIFVSYRREDKDDANKIIQLLHQNDYRIWYDRDISHGDYQDVLDQKVDGCGLFLTLLTENYCNSVYCTDEFSRAYHKGKTIMNLCLDKASYNLRGSGLVKHIIDQNHLQVNFMDDFRSDLAIIRKIEQADPDNILKKHNN